MSDITIKFENISEQYQLGFMSTRTLHDLNRWWQTTVLTGLQRIRKAVADDPTKQFTYRETQCGFFVELSDEVQKDSAGKNVEKIIRFIKKQPALTLVRLAEETGLSRRGIESIISRLKKQGILVREGGRKEGRWMVNEQDKI